MGQLRLLINQLKSNRSIIYFILYSMLTILLFLCSGNGFILFELSSKIRILLYIAIGLISIFVFILPIKPKKVLFDLKNKSIQPIAIPFIFTIVFLIFVLVSFAINNDRIANINTYLDICFVLVVSLLFSSRISYKQIAKYFNLVLLIVSVLSLFLYGMVCIGRYSFATSSFLIGTLRYDNYSFLNLFYNEKMHEIGGSPRFCSIFWEPGVYASFLLIAIVNEILFKKTRLCNIIIFTICLILTKSTASYVLFPFLIILFISNKIKQRKIKLPLIVGIYALVVIFFIPLFFGSDFLIKLFPTIFEKFSGSVSLTSRILSPYYYFQTFVCNAKTIFFGMGGVSANDYYYSLAEASKGLVDSGTSTSAYLLASYGFLGIFITILPLVGIAFNKRWDVPTKIAIAILFVFIFNKENHSSILFSILISYYLMSSLPKIKIKKKGYYCYSLAPAEKTIKDIIIGNNDKGVFGRNVFGSLVLRILALVVSVITIPTYTSFFSNSHNLDVWLVIYSVLGWILLFDFGFGNGMKNKLIKSFAKNDDNSARSIISNTYIPTCLISLAIFAILVPLCLFLNVNGAFGDSDNAIASHELKIALIIIAFSICLQFILRNISFIYQSQNRNVLGTSFSLISSSSFILLLTLIKGIDGPKFIYISISYLISINVPLLFANVVFFNKNHNLMPSIKEFSFAKCKGVMSLGIQYFAVQLCSLILWSSNSLLITHLFDPSSVNRYVYYYTCYYKLYSTIASLIAILSTTVWVSAGRAYNSHNNAKIIKLFKVTGLYASLLGFITIICSLALQFVFDLWLGTEPDSYINADFITVIIFSAYCILNITSESLIVFCNAFTRLKKQVLVSIAFAVLKVPLLMLLSFANALGNFWQIVVTYNIIYLLTMVVVLGLDIALFMKKEIKKYGLIKELNDGSNQTKEIMYYEIKI